MEFGLAMQDCDKCIELNPMFIKGYLRKAAVLKIDKPQVGVSMFEYYVMTALHLPMQRLLVCELQMLHEGRLSSVNCLSY